MPSQEVIDLLWIVGGCAPIVVGALWVIYFISRY